MTLPPNTPMELSLLRDVYELYTGHNMSIQLLAHNIETKLIYGLNVSLADSTSMVQIARQAGLEMRGSPDKLEIILHEQKE